MNNATKTKEQNESTGLALYKSEQFLAISQNDPDLQEALESIGELNEEFGPGDLTRVPTPASGGTKWEIPDASGGETTLVIEGALCAIIKCGLLWGSDEPQDGAKPVLRTFDLQTAEQVGPIPDDMIDTLNKYRIGGPDSKTFDWANLPYNEFGSGKNGEGKRVKEQRIMFILRKDDIYPIMVAAQPGSLKNIKKFILELPKFKIPIHRAIVSLSLEQKVNGSGIKYSTIVPKLIGTLSREDGEIIKQQYSEPLKKMITSGSVDVTGSDSRDPEDDDDF